MSLWTLETTINKSSSTAGRARRGKSVGTSTVTAQFLLQMHKKKMFYRENEGQSESIQHSQLCLSMTYFKINERYYTFLPLLSSFSRY